MLLLVFYLSVMVLSTEFHRTWYSLLLKLLFVFLYKYTVGNNSHINTRANTLTIRTVLFHCCFLGHPTFSRAFQTHTHTQFHTAHKLLWAIKVAGNLVNESLHKFSISCATNPNIVCLGGAVTGILFVVFVL